MLIEKLINADSINFEVMKEVMDDLECETLPELIEKLKNIDITNFVEIDKCVNFELTEKQKEILQNMWNHNISIVLLGKGCVDCDTEFLTPNGWKKISEFKKGDKVCVVNPYNNYEAWFEEPEDYIKIKTDEKSYEFRFKKYQNPFMILSEEHRVYYEDDEGNKYVDTVKDFVEKYKSYKIISNFNITKQEGLNLSIAKIRLMAVICSIGKFDKETKKAFVCLKDKRLIRRFKYLLSINGIKEYDVKYRNNGYYEFIFTPPLLTDDFSDFAYKANKKELEIMAEEIIRFYAKKDKNGNPYFKFKFRVRKSVIDFIQFCFQNLYDTTVVLRKYYRSGNRYYELFITKENGVKLSKSTVRKYRKFKDGYKYCFTTSTGFWLARKNNFIFITGNSGKSTMCCLLARYAIFKLLFEDEDKLKHNRIDIALLGSSASMVSSTLKRELAEQMKKSRLFNMFKNWWKIKRDTIEFFEGKITIHSLNSISSSLEGKNLYFTIIDEISDENFKDALKVFNQALTSTFSRFDNGRVCVITWTRFRSANPMADVGYRLYKEYQCKKDVYTIKASHYEVIGKYPKDYDPKDPEKLKMYDCEFVIDTRTAIPVETFQFIYDEPICDLKIYEDGDYIKFDLDIVKKNLPKYIFVHFDLSLKRDATTICLYYDDKIELHRIKPEKGKQISYESIENAIRTLRKIATTISFDSYNSALFCERYNGIKYTFSQKEQWTAMQSFLSKLPKLKFLINQNKNRIIDEFSNIYLDRNKEKWKYLGQGSSDCVDSIIYSIYSSLPYEYKLTKKDKKQKSEFGFTISL